MEMYRLESATGAYKEGLFTTQAEKCNSLGFDLRYIIGVFPDGEKMMFNGMAMPLENTISNPLSDGGLKEVKMRDGARVCTNVAKNFLNIESCYLSTEDACESSAYGRNRWDTSPKQKKHVVICGSEGEVGSDANLDNLEPRYSFYGPQHRMIRESLRLQLQAVPYQIFLTAKDQLRQRMAFALSQILVVSPNQVDNNVEETEIFHKYHDIFVRNAFGNYRDILKEVSYSPMVSSWFNTMSKNRIVF